ncbi:ATP-binding cassette domain-containing protein [Bacillus mycoides]|uniref:ATP-binding cassette domain-containing protein n=1 Tax=Bacillus mycoides TaxID=1405 RepID=UPI002110FA21|nr:ABC transporter ATP-binding protein [Bacillus mycoides]MCQ6527836.1 ABC transporter ATP-binding protein [Bacillus mycoides]
MLLQINNVKKTYKESAYVLKDICFDMNHQDKVAIIGKNGVGKSTLLKVIAGLLIPDEGEVLFQNNSLFNTPTSRRDIGFAFTEPVFYENLTVEENLIFLASLYKLSSIKKIVKDKINEFNIHDYKNIKISALSSGMKQKVQICAATIHDPKLLIMDEPFNKLDSPSLNFLYSFISHFDGGVLFTSHDKEHIYTLATKIFILKEGEIFYGMDYPSKVKSKDDFYEWYDSAL